MHADKANEPSHESEGRWLSAFTKEEVIAEKCRRNKQEITNGNASILSSEREAVHNWTSKIDLERIKPIEIVRTLNSENNRCGKAEKQSCRGNYPVLQRNSDSEVRGSYYVKMGFDSCEKRLAGLITFMAALAKPAEGTSEFLMISLDQRVIFMFLCCKFWSKYAVSHKLSAKPAQKVAKPLV